MKSHAGCHHRPGVAVTDSTPENGALQGITGSPAPREMPTVTVQVPYGPSTC